MKCWHPGYRLPESIHEHFPGRAKTHAVHLLLVFFVANRGGLRNASRKRLIVSPPAVTSLMYFGGRQECQTYTLTRKFLALSFWVSFWASVKCVGLTLAPSTIHFVKNERFDISLRDPLTAMKSLVVAGRPYFLREYNAFGKRNVWNALICIQVDVMTHIRFIG